jgi:hypothetical protein
LNVPELAMPPALREIGMSLGDRVAFDALKDFAVNELQRSDVYVKGEARVSEAAMRDFFERTTFGTLAPRIKRSARLPTYTLEYNGPIYDALVAAISNEAASAEELASRPSLATFGAKRIGDCLINLSLGGQVVPMRRLPSDTALLEHNRVVLRACLFEEGRPMVLASPATGMGLHISLLEALCMYLVTEVAPPERAAFISAFTKPIVVEDRPLRGEKLVRTVTRELDDFDTKLGPKLAELGILERTPR